MRKIKKTKRDLKALLREQTADMQVLDVHVRSEPILGWSAAFLVSDSVLGDDYQSRLFEIERDLRKKVELE